MIKEALTQQVPDSLRSDIELVQMSKLLNSAMQTHYYNPAVLREMSQSEIDNLILAVQLEQISG